MSFKMTYNPIFKGQLNPKNMAWNRVLRFWSQKLVLVIRAIRLEMKGNKEQKVVPEPRSLTKCKSSFNHVIIISESLRT